MYNKKFYAILATLTVLVGSLCLSPAISSLMNNVIIESTGQISIPTITAASGYWQDIQTAVDWVVAHGGVGNVYIPEGTWDFVNVDETLPESRWEAKVMIPAGINILGAPTERTSGIPYDGVGQNPNDQVVEWKTILVMPWDAPSGAWFQFNGDVDPNKPSRFSDIKMVGYRSVDPNSTTKLTGVRMCSVANFRIDHCYFENICGGLPITSSLAHDWTPETSYGVIDHCYLVNTHGYVVGWVGDRTVGYGVAVSRGNLDNWEPDVSKVLGKYTDYTVFIEDCYLEKWGHCTASGIGGHQVIRHSTIKDDFGYGSIDAHGITGVRCVNCGATDNYVWSEEQGKWVCAVCGSDLEIRMIGTRATEIYNNLIIDAIQYPWATFIRGGGGIAFNNKVGGGTYSIFIYLSNEAQEPASKCWINDWWVWNNTMLEGCAEISKEDPEGNIIEGENYFRYAPHTFNYTPYPYPHPLTLEAYP